MHPKSYSLNPKPPSSSESGCTGLDDSGESDVAQARHGRQLQEVNLLTSFQTGGKVGKQVDVYQVGLCHAALTGIQPGIIVDKACVCLGCKSRQCSHQHDFKRQMSPISGDPPKPEYFEHLIPP